MPRIAVFAGPSLSAADRDRPDFDFRGPAAAGDILSLLDDPPPALCLIDGYFDRTPAPWHKEILLLIETGTRVFGASSMGALRAAELARLGMTGVGTVFQAYRSGLLTGDDEVALIHAPASLGWAPLTVPMVEVRATLAKACRERMLDIATARQVRDTVHALHYEDRDWPAMEQACANLLDARQFRNLRELYVPLKRFDALRCLAAAMQAHRVALETSGTPRTYFIRRLARQRGVTLPHSTGPPRRR